MRRGDSVFQDFYPSFLYTDCRIEGTFLWFQQFWKNLGIFAMRGLEIIKGKIQKMLGDSQIQNVAKPGRNQMRDLQL